MADFDDLPQRAFAPRLTRMQSDDPTQAEPYSTADVLANMPQDTFPEWMRTQANKIPESGRTLEPRGPDEGLLSYWKRAADALSVHDMAKGGVNTVANWLGATKGTGRQAEPGEGYGFATTGLGPPDVLAPTGGVVAGAAVGTKALAKPSLTDSARARYLEWKHPEEMSAFPDQLRFSREGGHLQSQESVRPAGQGAASPEDYYRQHRWAKPAVLWRKRHGLLAMAVIYVALISAAAAERELHSNLIRGIFAVHQIESQHQVGVGRIAASEIGEKLSDVVVVVKGRVVDHAADNRWGKKLGDFGYPESGESRVDVSLGDRRANSIYEWVRWENFVSDNAGNTSRTRTSRDLVESLPSCCWVSHDLVFHSNVDGGRQPEVFHRDLNRQPSFATLENKRTNNAHGSGQPWTLSSVHCAVCDIGSSSRMGGGISGGSPSQACEEHGQSQTNQTRYAEPKLKPAYFGGFLCRIRHANLLAEIGLIALLAFAGYGLLGIGAYAYAECPKAGSALVVGGAGCLLLFLLSATWCIDSQSKKRGAYGHHEQGQSAQHALLKSGHEAPPGFILLCHPEWGKTYG